jgi:DNA-3-methyladenine glycosylase II
MRSTTRDDRSQPSRPLGRIRSLTRQSLHRGVGELCRRDGPFADVIGRFGPPPMWSRPPGFATLTRIILEQQVSLASASAAYARLQRVAGRVTPSRVAALSEARLRRAGLTRQKASYCHGLARQVVDRTIDLAGLSRLADDEVRAQLTAVRGVGAWSADIYLLMALRRPDVWPDGDLALPKAASQLRGRPSPMSQEELRELAVGWAPWHAVAARILWHAYLSTLRQERARAR